MPGSVCCCRAATTAPSLIGPAAVPSVRRAPSSPRANQVSRFHSLLGPFALQESIMQPIWFVSVLHLHFPPIVAFSVCYTWLLDWPLDGADTSTPQRITHDACVQRKRMRKNRSCRKTCGICFCERIFCRATECFFFTRITKVRLELAALFDSFAEETPAKLSYGAAIELDPSVLLLGFFLPSFFLIYFARSAAGISVRYRRLHPWRRIWFRSEGFGFFKTKFLFDFVSVFFFLLMLLKETTREVGSDCARHRPAPLAPPNGRFMQMTSRFTMMRFRSIARRRLPFFLSFSHSLILSFSLSLSLFCCCCCCCWCCRGWCYRVWMSWRRFYRVLPGFT